LFDISLSTLKELGMTEASKFVGERLLLLMPETRRLLTGLAATVDVDQIEASIEKLRLKINSDSSDTESMYRVAMLLISRATAVDSWADIEDAESLLRRASDAGHAEACDFLLKTWPDIKAGYLKEG
jgi:TPR repeat protein